MAFNNTQDSVPLIFRKFLQQWLSDITEGLSGPTVDEKLFNQLQEESCQGTFLCQQLTYIVPDEKFYFQVGKILPLGAP